MNRPPPQSVISNMCTYIVSGIQHRNSEKRTLTGLGNGLQDSFALEYHNNISNVASIGNILLWTSNQLCCLAVIHLEGVFFRTGLLLFSAHPHLSPFQLTQILSMAFDRKSSLCFMAVS